MKNRAREAEDHIIECQSLLHQGRTAMDRGEGKGARYGRLFQSLLHQGRSAMLPLQVTGYKALTRRKFIDTATVPPMYAWQYPSRSQFCT